MSKKDKEIPSKEEAKAKIADKEVEEALKDRATLTKQNEYSQEEIKDLEKKAEVSDEYKDRLLRAQADYENHKKRLAREKEEFLKFSNAELVATLLPILDNFDLALKHAQEDHDPKHILQGIEMIQKLFKDVLKKQGVEEIKSLGEKFDPHKHEAIGFEETDKDEEGNVTEVIQIGYTLHNRLVRPATVKITKKKSK